MAAAKKSPLTAETKSVLEIVTRKFESDKILSRSGQGGRNFNYVKAQEYIARLNEAFGFAWGVEVKEHFLVNNQVVMCVSITVTNPDNGETYTRDGWGGHPLGQDPSNSFKSAFSKALTKAASIVGVGLHLWGVDSEEDDSPTWDIQSDGPTEVRELPITPPPVPQSGNSGVPPSFVNPTPPSPPSPPVTNVSSPPPIPVPNPNPGASVGSIPGTGPDGKPLGPVTASVGVQSSESNKIQDFQVNGIVGAAMTRGKQPKELIQQILGNPNLDVHDLTLEQAQIVLDAVRNMPPQ